MPDDDQQISPGPDQTISGERTIDGWFDEEHPERGQMGGGPIGRMSLQGLNRKQRRQLEEAQRNAYGVVRIQRVRVSGTSDTISYKTALHDVGRGAARWVKDTDTGERCIEMVGHVRESIERSLATNTSDKVASELQIAGLPMVRPCEVLAPSPQRNFGWKKATWKNKPGRTQGEIDYLNEKNKNGTL